MQLEIDQLKRKLRHARRKRTPSDSNISSNDGKDASYRQRLRTPPSESFSYDEELHHKHRYKSLPYKGLGNDTMSKALNHISKSPLHAQNWRGKTSSAFQSTNAHHVRTDPVEHVSHFNQRMVVHSKNEALMCKVFPSSLGPMAMRCFDGLGASSTNSFKELTQAFGSRFITCNRVPRPLGSLLSLSMREGETLKMYSDRY